MKIGLISDTHSHLDTQVLSFLKDCDEIWHAGDIGSIQVLDKLEQFKPVRAVYGNIDDYQIRLRTKAYQYFKIHEQIVFMTHIGGSPNKYAKGIEKLLIKFKPNLFISGHSHIMSVVFDKRYQVLFINPGAAGNKGWHKFVTAIRFVIDEEGIKNVDVFEKES